MAAIAQEITITESGLSFLDWVDSLTGDAKTAALAAVADRDSKFDAQVAAGNVYFNKDAKRVWVSAEAEQAHMDEVGQLYSDLWTQWESETGGSLVVSVDDAPTAQELALPLVAWTKANLSAEDFTTFMTQLEAVKTAVGDRTIEDLTAEETAELQAANPLFKSTREAYESYLAAL